MRATFHGIRLAILVLACYWIALTTATHVSASLVASVHAYDKLIHFSAFGGLAFLIAWAVPTNVSRPSQNVLIAAFVASCYSAIDELTQIPVGRTADFFDFIADLLGILLGLLVYMVSRRILVKSGFYLNP